MEIALAVLVLVIIGFALLKVQASRTKERAAKKARADKRAKSDRDDANAIRRSVRERR